VDDLNSIVEVFEKAAASGKLRYWGFNGLGETDSIKEALVQYSPSGIHTCYNMLNPTSGYQLPKTFPYQNYKELMKAASGAGIGTVGIRILAGGALSGSLERHPIAQQNVAPIATSSTFQEDVSRTSAFEFLSKEGFVDNLVEASVRFAISNDDLDIALIDQNSTAQLKLYRDHHC
jgi:aryl-alcohol dehydrogenase-like predicted oxidoreductase